MDFSAAMHPKHFWFVAIELWQLSTGKYIKKYCLTPPETGDRAFLLLAIRKKIIIFPQNWQNAKTVKILAKLGYGAEILEISPKSSKHSQNHHLLANFKLLVLCTQRELSAQLFVRRRLCFIFRFYFSILVSVFVDCK